MNKYIIFLIGLFLAFSYTPKAYANVSMNPDPVATAKYETFRLTVPNEKSKETIQVRLVIPDEVNNVVPFVKPGWNVNIIKDQDKVREIIWHKGKIPVGQKDEFVFSAQTPAFETTIAWKTYQTFDDNSVTAWENNPKDNMVEADTPYATSHVTNADSASQQTQSALPLILSIAAMSVALASLGMQLFK